jgi:nucleotide-binding universal stress UspA family protein
MARPPEAVRPVVLAALDASGAAAPVAAAARAFGDLLGVGVRAVHVGSPPASEAARRAAEREGLELEVVDPGAAPPGGDPVLDVLGALIEAPEVLAVAVGARRWPGGRYPAGHVPLELPRRSTKPVLVVPPEPPSPSPPSAAGMPPLGLVCLEATEDADRALGGALPLLAGRGAEIVALHVFDERTVPRFWDQPAHAAGPFGREFLSRHLRGATGRLELRTGSPAGRIIEVARDENAALVVLATGGGSRGLRAVVAREVLSRATVPVLLVPKRPRPPRQPRRAAAR